MSKIEVDGGIVARVLLQGELREMGSRIQCRRFVILWPVRHGHSPPICRWSRLSIVVRGTMRRLDRQWRVYARQPIGQTNDSMLSPDHTRIR